MEIEGDCNILESQWSVNAQGLVDIILGKLFYVYITISATKPVGVPKLFESAYLSNIPALIIHVRYNDLYMLKDADPVPTQCQKSDNNQTENIVYFKRPERHNEQVHGLNTVKI